MTNKFLPTYIENDVNKFAITPEEIQSINNTKAATEGDDIVFNRGEGLVSLGQSSTERQIEVYKERRRQDAKPAEVNSLSNKAIRNELTDEEAVEFKAQLQNPEFGYNHYLNQIRANDPTGRLEETQVKELAGSMYARSLIAEAADGVGYTEQAVNFVSLLTLPQQTAILHDIFPEQSMATITDSAQFVKKFAEGYKQLPPEQKPHVARQVFDRVQGATPNELWQIITLLDLIGDEGTSLKSLQFSYAMDKLDALTLGIGGVVAGKQILKGRRAVGALQAVKDVKIASEVAEAAAIDGATAAKVGVNRMDAANSADMAKVDMLEGADPDMTRLIMNEWEKQDTMLSRIPTLLTEGMGIQQAEKIAALEHRVKAITRAVRARGDTVSHATGKLKPDGSIEIKADVVESGTGTKKVETTNDYLKLDDETGRFREVGMNTPESLLTSPNYHFRSDRDRLLQAYERIGYQSAALKQVLATSFNDVTKGLGKNSLNKLDEILKLGDEAEEVFSVGRLTTTGVSGKVLTQNEAIAYAKTRALYDQLHRLEDIATTKSFNAQGLRRVTTSSMDEGMPPVVSYAKPYDDINGAWTSYSKDQHQMVKLPSIGSSKVRAQTRDDLVSWYNQGFVLARALKQEDNLFQAAGTRVQWALVKADEVQAIKGGVLPYKVGYVPRIGEKEFYFAKIADEGVSFEYKVDSDVSKTLATFESKTDADAWVARYNAGVPKGEALATTVADRQLEKVVTDANQLKRYGGLVSGHRSGRDIPHVNLAGVEVPRTFENSYVAMQRAIDHVSRRLPMSEYRFGVEKVWLNTAADFIPEIKIRNYSFDEAVGLLSNPATRGLDHRAKTFLETAAKQIQYHNGVMSKGEEAWEGTMKGIGNTFEKIPGGKGMARWLYKRDSADPISAIKGATFHLMLGAGNLAQYIIQGSGATIAMAMHPIHAAKIMPKLPMYTVLDNIPNHVTRAKAAHTLEKWMQKSGMLAKDTTFADDYLAWNRTGVREGIIHTNVDAANAYSANPLSSVTASKFMTGASKLSTAPYSAGELINARMSFFVALSEQRTIGTAGRKLTNSDVAAAVAKGEQYRLNMNKANKAFYQKGMLSVTTQFMSVNFRFMEAMLGTAFTGKEKSALIFGQAALFGTLGVPFLDVATRHSLGAFGFDPDQVLPQFYNDFREGLLGLALGAADIDDVDVVNRVALGEGFADQIVRLSTEAETPLMFLAGVSSIPGQRGIDSIQGIVNTIRMVKSADEIEAGDMAFAVDQFARYIAEVPSSSRKAIFAYHAYNSRMFQDKNHIPIVFNDNNPLEDLMIAVGFNSKSLSDYYELKFDNMDIEKRRRETTKLIIRTWKSVDEAVQAGNMDATRGHQIFASGILSSFSNPEDVTKILGAIQDNATLNNDKTLTELLKILGNYHSDFISAGQKMNTVILDEAAKRGGQ